MVSQPGKLNCQTKEDSERNKPLTHLYSSLPHCLFKLTGTVDCEMILSYAK